MDEAAPQAARDDGRAFGMQPARSPQRDTLEALRHGWGDAYEIGHDDERGWRARRRDGLGGDIMAGNPDGLWGAILADYTARPVPRDYSAPLED